MIKSLNVNQFLGKNNWNSLKGQFEEKKRIWDRIKKFYYDYIFYSVLTENDVLILHEVPYVDEKKYTDNNGNNGYKRSSNISFVYSELKQYCEEKDFQILTPTTNETAFFRTISICKKVTKYKPYKINFVEFSNRIIGLFYNDVLIIGVHIPDSSNRNVAKYWEQLNNVIMNNTSRRILCIGDLNTFKSGTLNKIKLAELMSHDLVDIWLEQGYRHTKTTSDYETRIDYALTSGKKYDSFNMKIYIDDDVRENGYSDHSALYLI